MADAIDAPPVATGSVTAAATEYGDVSSEESTGGEPPIVGMPQPEPQPEPEGSRATATDGSTTVDEDDGDDDESFYSRGRHFLVMSYAGKPIYSRYGGDARLATIVPFVTAMIQQFEVSVSSP